jgi:hypothetical protein
LERRNVPIAPAIAALELVVGLVQAVARQRIALRDEDDWPILASALALDCAIWTEDTDFFGCGVATWTTDRIELYLFKPSPRPCPLNIGAKLGPPRAVPSFLWLKIAPVEFSSSAEDAGPDFRCQGTRCRLVQARAVKSATRSDKPVTGVPRKRKSE